MANRSNYRSHNGFEHAYYQNPMYCNDSDGNTESTNKICKKHVVIIIITSCILFVLFGITAASVTLSILTRGDKATDFYVIANMSITVGNLNLTGSLENPSAVEYKQFCSEIGEVYKDNSSIGEYFWCNVTDLRSGSIIIFFEVFFTNTNEEKVSNFAESILRAYLEANNYQLGKFKIIVGTLNLIEVSRENSGNPPNVQVQTIASSSMQQTTKTVTMTSSQQSLKTETINENYTTTSTEIQTRVSKTLKTTNGSTVQEVMTTPPAETTNTRIITQQTTPKYETNSVTKTPMLVSSPHQTDKTERTSQKDPSTPNTSTIPSFQTKEVKTSSASRSTNGGTNRESIITTPQTIKFSSTSQKIVTSAPWTTNTVTMLYQHVTTQTNKTMIQKTMTEIHLSSPITSAETKNTETPDITDQPTETPDITDQPTETPNITDQPTETPDITDQPPETPDITDQPTETPDITDQPTETPAITDQPTETPDITDRQAETTSGTTYEEEMTTFTPLTAEISTMTQKRMTPSQQTISNEKTNTAETSFSPTKPGISSHEVETQSTFETSHGTTNQDIVTTSSTHTTKTPTMASNTSTYVPHASITQDILTSLTQTSKTATMTPTRMSSVTHGNTVVTQKTTVPRNNVNVSTTDLLQPNTTESTTQEIRTSSKATSTKPASSAETTLFFTTTEFLPETAFSCTNVTVELYSGPHEITCTIGTHFQYDQIGVAHFTSENVTVYAIVLNRDNGRKNITSVNDSDINVIFDNKTMLTIIFENASCIMDGFYEINLLVDGNNLINHTKVHLEIKRSPGPPVLTLDADQVIDLMFVNGSYYRTGFIHTCEGYVGHPPGSLVIEYISADGMRDEPLKDITDVNITKENTTTTACENRERITFGVKFTEEMSGGKLRCKLEISTGEFENLAAIEDLALIPRNICVSAVLGDKIRHPTRCDTYVECLNGIDGMYPMGVKCNSSQCHDGTTGICSHNCASDSCIEIGFSCTNITARLYSGPHYLTCVVGTSMKFSQIGIERAVSNISDWGFVLNRKDGSVYNTTGGIQDINVTFDSITTLIITFINISCSMGGFYKINLFEGTEVLNTTTGHLQVLNPPGEPVLTMNADQVIDLSFDNGSYYRTGYMHQCEGNVGYPPGFLEIQIIYAGTTHFQNLSDITEVNISREDITETSCEIRERITFGLRFTEEMDGGKVRCIVPGGFDNGTTEALYLIPRNICSCASPGDKIGHPIRCDAYVECIERNIPLGVECGPNLCRRSNNGMCTSDCSSETCNQEVSPDFCNQSDTTVQSPITTRESATNATETATTSQ